MVLVLGLFPTRAQLPLTRLATVFPPGAATGTTTEITITGSDLDDLSAFVVSDPRITATPSRPGASAFQLAVPAEIEPGLVEVRVLGRFGLSNPRVFAIGTGPESTAAPTNTSIATAFPLPPETRFSGRAAANAYVWFQSTNAPGQHLAVEVEARDLDSRLVPDLAVLDAAGNELAVARRREWLDFVVPADGRFHVRLNDQTFRGGDDFAYRLRLTAAPRIEFALPLALRPGETNRVTLYGRRLPGSQPGALRGPDGQPWEELTVAVAAPPVGVASVSPRRPATAVLAGTLFPWSFRAPNGTARPVMFSLTSLPDAAPPLLSTSSPPPTLAIPGEISGVFPPRAAPVIAAFTAKKGESLVFESFADRLGFAADPWFLIQRHPRDASSNSPPVDVVDAADTEAPLTLREFDAGSRDAACRFQAPEDGRYELRIRDLYQSPDRPWRLPYRIVARRPAPDFHLVALPQPPPRLNDNDRQIHLWTTVLRRGETLPVRVLAFRRDGFDGPITISAARLPDAITASPTIIPRGQNAATLLLTASETATNPLPTALTLLGRAQVGEVTLEHLASAGTGVWPVADWDQEKGNGRPALSLAASVCVAEIAPVRLVPQGPNTRECATNATVKIGFAVRRGEGFNGALKLKAAGRSEFDKAKEVEIPEGATNAVLELDVAELKLPPGTHSVWLQGLVTGRYRNQPEALAAAEAALRAADKAVTDATPETKAAAETMRKSAQAARQAAEERAKPRDLTVAVYSPPITLVVQPAPARPTP